MRKKSRIVESNQSGVHTRLAETVQKHLLHPFQRPIAQHSKTTFEEVQREISAAQNPLVLDSCCGVGDSSRTLAKIYPDHLVIGVDKSAHRLGKERIAPQPENLILVRADLNDFYRLAAEEGWRLERHYMLYPNPWPKAAHLGRRWHGAPVFPDMLRIGGVLELRSNWRLYLEEFQIALEIAGHASTLQPFKPGDFLTAFEKKYAESGQPLWQLVCDVAAP